MSLSDLRCHQSLPTGRILALRALRASNAVARRNVMVAPSTEDPVINRAEYMAQLAARIAAQKTHHHYDQAEELSEAAKWFRICAIVALPLCALSSVKDILFGEHEHGHEGVPPEYMHILNKDYPWECKECALFDRKCWKECRAKE